LLKLIRAKEAAMTTAGGKKHHHHQTKAECWQDSPFPPTKHFVSSPKTATSFLRRSMSIVDTTTTTATFRLKYRQQRARRKKACKDTTKMFPALSSQDLPLIKISSFAAIRPTVMTLLTKNHLRQDNDELISRGPSRDDDDEQRLDDQFCNQLFMATKEHFLLTGDKNKLMDALQKKISAVETRNAEFISMIRPRLISYGIDAEKLTEGLNLIPTAPEAFSVDEIQILPYSACTSPSVDEPVPRSLDETVRHVQSCFEDHVRDSCDQRVQAAVERLKDQQEGLVTIYNRYIQASASSSEAAREESVLAKEMGLDEAPSTIFLVFTVGQGKGWVLRDRIVFIRRRLIGKKAVSSHFFDEIDGHGNELNVLTGKKKEVLSLQAGTMVDATAIGGLIGSLNKLMSGY
jgi:hypothetical protein